MKRSLFIRRVISSILLLGLIPSCCFFAAGCSKSDGSDPASTNKTPSGNSTISLSGTLTAVSDTGIKMTTVADSNTASDKQVGIFYFLWQGTSIGSSYPHNYDNTEILKNFELPLDKKIKADEWLAAGGGGLNDWHWWGEPLFGYYDMLDRWVINKHMQMLTDAGVDFIMIDFTNGVLNGYIKRLETIFSVLFELKDQGFKVPRVVCCGYDDSPSTVDSLYKQFYAKHPEYEELYYHWNNHEKPLMFDNISGYNKVASSMIYEEDKIASYCEGAQEMFEFRDLAFPHETKGNGDPKESFLYLDFRYKPMPVVDSEDYSFCCVSLAEICETNHSNYQWYGNNGDRTRNWDGKQNRNWLEGEEDAYLYGYNFAREFEFAMSKDPDMIFITGWNEWVAQLHIMSDGSISFVDNADINNSRDIEPMKGGYGDNYYIQMCDYISKFKYGDSIVPSKSNRVTIDPSGDISQWDNSDILTYTDYTGDTISRSRSSAHDWTLKYTNETGRNDIKNVKITYDKDNIYFYCDTVEDITGWDKVHCMSLFINTGKDSSSSWYGFDHVINRQIAVSDTEAVLEKSKGGWSWESAGNVKLNKTSKTVVYTVPRSLLGISDSEFSLSFKWADNYQDEGDIWSFYTDGDCAPYGRMSYGFAGK